MTHRGTHAPETHRRSSAHPRLHPAQWRSLVRVSTSQPLVRSPSQSANPALHRPNTHKPAAHIAVAPAYAHRAPQAPQSARLVRMLTSQPFSWLRSQSANAGSHATTAHPPATHATREALSSMHCERHAPQLSGDVAVFVSQPFDGSPSQSAVMGAHGAGASGGGGGMESTHPSAAAASSGASTASGGGGWASVPFGPWSGTAGASSGARGASVDTPASDGQTQAVQTPTGPHSCAPVVPPGHGHGAERPRAPHDSSGGAPHAAAHNVTARARRAMLMGRFYVRSAELSHCRSL